jgi:hypothetical protein
VEAGQGAHELGDLVDSRGRRAPVGRACLDPGVNLVVQAGHADHEELVEVAGVDRQELHALE